MNYRKINNVSGWAVALIAFIVYILTMEPTVSFWDCGEFLSCAYKIEVGHSPGAPLFMLLQRMFGLFSGSAAWTGGYSAKAAWFINMFSVLTSALTILFLFWTITHIARKLVTGGNHNEPDSTQTTLIIGSGLVGALAYTFSDTFWFSAVEAEVYATSSFFTALVFWAILKWESIADQRYADRWLIFIAYMMGLSIGIHLLNLLTIPAIALVYYFRRYQPTVRGSILALVAGAALLGFVQFGVIQGLPALAFYFDYLFVNSFGLPVDSGALVFLALFIGLLIWLLQYARKRGNYSLHTAILSLMFIIIGFASYLAPVIRSRADVAIDMTNPDNSDRFLSYVNREQFGQQPLIYGPDYNSPVVDYNTDSKLYSVMMKDGKERYEVVGSKVKPIFERKRLFPRIWDNNDPSHVSFYKSYLGLSQEDEPTAKDNLSFFFRYQLNWMWWRYFMWNYVGRQNDVEGQGEPRAGNWISGIKPIDKMMGRGDIDKMGDGFSNNRARNQLYFLPFILGILGMVFHFNRHRRDAIIVLMLFFFTGIAVVLYLNNTPLQPRERDYAYAGSTYAFAIWIGLGVLMLYDWFAQRKKAGMAVAGAVLVVCMLAGPVLMASVEWNDHDRSHKTLALESARNTLESCEQNALLFTFGDNDTYPLWYAQEIEGIRPDIRVINMSLLGIDWYINQLNYKINTADAVPMLWKFDQFVGDHRNYVLYNESPQIGKDKYVNLVDLCNFMNDDNPSSLLPTRNGPMNYMPTRNIFVTTLSKDQLVAQHLLPLEDTGRVTTEMKFTFGKDAAYKDDLAVLNIVGAISQQGWKRPIYFSGGLGTDNYQGMQDYLKLEGIVYRLMPYKYLPDSNSRRVQGEMGFVDADKSYKLFQQYKWGGAEKNDVYFDEKNKIMFQAYRNNAPRIAENLSRIGRKGDAERLLDHVDAGISQSSYPFNPYVINMGFEPSAYFMANGYYQIDTPTARMKGRNVAMKFVKNMESDVNWIMTLNDDGKESMADDVARDFDISTRVAFVAATNKDLATAKEILGKLTVLKSLVDRAINPELLKQLEPQLQQLDMVIKQPQMLQQMR